MANKTDTDTTCQNKQSSIPRGKPKSGRVWKTVRTERHSSIKKEKSLRTSWEQKMARKQEKAQFKEILQSMKDARAQEKQRQRKLMEENRKKKLENQRKSEVVQEIKNTAKIKKMRKKHLKSIETR